MTDYIDRRAAIDALERAKSLVERPITETRWFDLGLKKAQEVLSELPSAQPEWDNHTVACLLAELFGDTCACNYNDIAEWLPEKCELLDSCPYPVGVACWEQFLTHKAEEGEAHEIDRR